jgi:hypothetical protein
MTLNLTVEIAFLYKINVWQVSLGRLLRHLQYGQLRQGTLTEGEVSIRLTSLH